MTHNQINYWTLQESRKHNRAIEKEEKRSNKAREKETRRANKAQETIKTNELAESIRAHKASEGIDISKLAETSRHNKTSEGQYGVELGIKAATQAEQERENKAQDLLKARDINVKQQQANTAQQLADAETAYKKVQSVIATQKSIAEQELSASTKKYYDQQVKNLQQQIELKLKEYKLSKNQAIYKDVMDLIDKLSKLYIVVKGAKG